MSNVINSVDDFTEIERNRDALWGLNTQHSLTFFNIGSQCFESSFIDVLVTIKRAAAHINFAEGHLSTNQYQAIIFACTSILKGGYRDQFPLKIWQTGSGTQTNMNVNEVIASLARAHISEQAEACKGLTLEEIHPNDHINMSQSSNDVFPSAMHIAVALQSTQQLLPSLNTLCQYLRDKQSQFSGISTVGRTHLMDALPLPAEALLSAQRSQLEHAKSSIVASLDDIYKLALGGTAVGSGANASPTFGKQIIEYLAEHYQLPLMQHDNLYAAVSGEYALLQFSTSLKFLASVLLKIANDFRLLGSGPRCGFNEWFLPANEAGSSIMPGKVNPTQCEALSMVCIQVFGNELTISLAAANGQLQLNTYRPVIIHNVMESINLLSDAMTSFSEYCLRDLTLNKKQIDRNMMNNLSVITLLAPEIGYDTAATIVKEAERRHVSLGESAEFLGLFSRTDFNATLQKYLARSLNK